jgi:hypothetical protein
MTCAEWAERHGFIYAEEIIPDEWLKGKWVLNAHPL